MAVRTLAAKEHGRIRQKRRCYYDVQPVIPNEPLITEKPYRSGKGYPPASSSSVEQNQSGPSSFKENDRTAPSLSREQNQISPLLFNEHDQTASFLPEEQNHTAPLLHEERYQIASSFPKVIKVAPSIPEERGPIAPSVSAERERTVPSASVHLTLVGCPDCHQELQGLEIPEPATPVRVWRNVDLLAMTRHWSSVR